MIICSASNFTMSELISISRISTSDVGTRGEILAQDYLLRHKFRLVCSNFKTPVGRNRKGVSVNGEIDLIAYEENILCFIEVKTRTSDDFAAPIQAVDLRKQRQIIRAAKRYRKIFRLENSNFATMRSGSCCMRKSHL